jgi:predicted transcriptional regulator of viral defense system
MSTLSGMGKLDRERMTAILRGAHHTINIPEAADILHTSKEKAAKLLAYWASKGWFSRIQRGTYIPVPIESLTTDIALEDPWIIAEKLYQPCYIGGWSAAEYWGFTEQIFRTITVFTVKKPRERHPEISGTDFLLKTISERAMYGLKTVWRGQIKVLVSDPTRTILDFLIEPKTGGGIRHVIDMFINYLKSEHKNLDLLLEYAQKLNNGAIFKRLGFLLERYAPEEKKVIENCKKYLTTGNIKLDPSLESERLITRWRLWIPEEWCK